MTNCVYAHQGHRYLLDGREVISMQSGQIVNVCPIEKTEPYPLGKSLTVDASDLTPLPMRYFDGDLPA